MRILPAEPRRFAEVVELWEAAGLTRPWNDPIADLRRAVRGPASAVLVGLDGERMVASVMIGHDGHRGWVYYLAVRAEHRGRGLGRAMMAAAEDWLRERGIPKLNLMVRSDNTPVIGFYRALGFDADDVRVVSRRLDDARVSTGDIVAAMLSAIDHVGVAVPSIDDALPFYRDVLGMALVHRETVSEQGVAAALLDVGDGHVELIEPLSAEGGVARFLADRGPGLHHVAYRVASIEAALRACRAAGLRLIDERPRTGIRGSRVAFLHPKTSGGVLTEIVQPAERDHT